MKKLKRYFSLISCISALMMCISLNVGLSQIPDSLDGKIDMLAGSVNENAMSKEYFIRLGPEAVPILTKKLIESLSEGASPEAARERNISDMPTEDQKRVNHQAGIISMQMIALLNMPLSTEVKRAALDSVSRALKSPYSFSRGVALRSLAYAGGKDFVEQIIPILDDNDKFNRVAAADMLAMIGDSSTVEKVEKVLEARRQGLTEDQIERDWSFKHGYSAITALKTKESTQPIAQSPHSDSLRPIKTAMPLPAVAEIRPPLPIVPIGIIFLAIVGILAYLILRKR